MRQIGDEIYYDINEFAEKNNVKTNTVRQWIRRGMIDSYTKFDGKNYILIDTKILRNHSGSTKKLSHLA